MFDKLKAIFWRVYRETIRVIEGTVYCRLLPMKPCVSAFLTNDNKKNSFLLFYATFQIHNHFVSLITFRSVYSEVFF